MNTLPVQFEAETYEALRLLSYKNRVSMSALVRSFVKYGLEKNEVDHKNLSTIDTPAT